MSILFNIPRPIHRLMILAMIGLSLILTSCSEKEKEEENPGPKPDTRYEQVHAKQVIKGIDEFLGKGYKGYQYYANPQSCTTALFDLSDRNLVSIQKTPQYKGRFATGENKTQFYDQFSAGISVAGTYDAFSGEITSNFSKESLRNRNNSFATAHITQTYYRLTVLDPAPLKPEISSDLATMEPVELFDRYGTHYLKSIYIGGRISFSSYIDRTAVKEGFDIKATMNAAYAKVVKGSASMEKVEKSDVEQMNVHKQIDVMGGDPALANNITDGSGEPSDTYNAWSQSVPDFMSIADFADGGLIPIYELAGDPDRKAVLEKAWTQYMAARTDPILKESEPRVIQKNEKIQLQGEDGRYYGKAPYNATYSYYYPTIADSAQTLKLAGNAEPLLNKHIVTIKTTESFSNTITGKWSKRVYLGAFQLKHWLYYWTTDGAKTNWFIEKAVVSSDKAIRDGDTVFIRNEFFNDQYLAPEKDSFLTTKKTPYSWTIRKIE